MTSDKAERYFPESLVRAYFNYCRASALEPSANGLLAFATEVQGDQHINGISTFKTLGSLFKMEK